MFIIVIVFCFHLLFVLYWTINILLVSSYGLFSNNKTKLIDHTYDYVTEYWLEKTSILQIRFA